MLLEMIEPVHHKRINAVIEMTLAYIQALNLYLNYTLIISKKNQRIQNSRKSGSVRSQ